MLIRFVVSNFLSFDEETEFNMLAGNFKQHKEHVYKVGKLKVLKAAAIYGANAAGKSNLIKAIDTLQEIVKMGEVNFNLENKKFKLNPLNKDKPIQFEIEFSIKNKIYAYGVTINKNKIVEEWLYESRIDEDDILIFDRKFDKKGKLKIELGEKYITPKYELLIELLEDNLLKENDVLLGKYEELKIEDVTNVQKWIRENLMIVYPNQVYAQLTEILRDKRFYDFANTSINSINIGISNILFKTISAKNYFGNEYNSLEEEFKEKLENNKKYFFYKKNNLNLFIYESDNEFLVSEPIYAHQTNKGQIIDFQLEEESEGTQRLINLLPVIFFVTYFDVSVLIDEIDQSIHVNLLYELVEKIMKQKDTKGQLIFTTHESNLLDLKIFRQDEIWFAEKDRQKGSTQLYSLSEFNPRYDLDIRKGYLQGRFGAIPFLVDLEKLDWSNLEIKPKNQEQNQEENND